MDLKKVFRMYLNILIIIIIVALGVTSLTAPFLIFKSFGLIVSIICTLFISIPILSLLLSFDEPKIDKFIDKKLGIND